MIFERTREKKRALSSSNSDFICPSMADDKKVTKSTDDTKSNKPRTKTPVLSEKKKEKSVCENNRDRKSISSPNGKAASDSEDEISLETPDGCEENSKNNNSKSLIEFTKGLRIEVKYLPTDSWYDAKVVDVEGTEVLIHYINWAVRHDEWISMDSNRIRALSENNKPPAVVAPVPMRKRGRTAPGVKNKAPSVAAEPPVMEKEEDSVSYTEGERVKAIWTDSRKYPAKIIGVLENDMYKVVFNDGVEKVLGKSKISKSKPTDISQYSPSAPLPAPQNQETPVGEDLESKESRRQRKRKLNVLELFRKKSCTPKSTPESPAPVPAKRLKIEAPEEPKLTSPTTSEAPVQKRGRGRPPRKSAEASELKDSIKEEPLDGDFSADIKSEFCSDTSVVGSTSVLLTKKEENSQPSVSESKKVPLAANPVNERQLETPEVQNEIIIGSLKIERDGDNLKCPKQGCGKLLRKETLIMMHIKHYHPELKEQMDVVPQVLDYAYARYINDLPSTASMIRNFTNPPASSAPSTPNVGPKKKPAKSLVKSVAETIKSEEPILTPIVPSLTPRIQLGKSSSKSTSKSGLKVKTMLPVRKPVSAKPLEAKEKAEPRKSLEMPVLKKALMTPPMNSSTPIKSTEGVVKEDKPKQSPLKRAASPPPKKSPRKSPRKDQLIEDGAMELVNCLCGYTEEDGLIIQCDLCFCWQHGACNNIEREEDVPEKFICHVCGDPPRERKSRKYSHDQDWLKKGILPRLPVLRLNEKNERSSLEKALKETQDLASAALSLSEVMHALKVQLNIAQKKDHPKLYLWSKEWNDVIKDEAKDSVEIKANPEPATIEAQQNNFVPVEPPKLENNLIETHPIVPFEPIPGTSGSQGPPVDDVDLHPALKLPLSELEIEHLASTMAESIPASELPMESSMRLAIKAPEPEAPIQPEKCRVMLVKHIQRLQDQLEARINELEERNLGLERRAPQIYGKDVSDARVKETLRMLRRDVGSVHKIGTYTMKDKL
ncbi:Hypothetical predicted protein [Cloeon dipterum]|uniref:C2H2-type domain-containing protein n=1 Tax=Cloeon dipterum TaxID=197152 RepID=A0A8S1CEN6_9INSE|nr:Hypothetical predicted protein [Cloeon dipterum]